LDIDDKAEVIRPDERRLSYRGRETKGDPVEQRPVSTH
jgi:hypothetical protein